MNVYDFDKTIYHGDCTFDFYKYCLKKDKTIVFLVPKVAFACFRYLAGFITKEEFKETFFQFLFKFKNLEEMVEDFWNLNQHKIKKFYLKNKRKDDLVISASPEFLIKPICNRLNIASMGSRNDINTGKFTGLNCHGKEKVRRFYEVYKNGVIEEFYSDSYVDDPLAQIAKKAYMVDGEKLLEWYEKKKTAKYKLKKIFFNKEFFMFLIVGCINTFNGIFFAFFYSLFIENVNIAFVCGYLTALTISYFLNSILSFKSTFSFEKYLKFCISYIPNFVIQNIIVLLVYNMLHFHKIIAYSCAAIIGIPVTFILMKFFVFGKKEKKNEA